MKRIFDLIISLLIIFLISLPFIVLCLIVYIYIGKPIFFKQIRPGRYGIPFQIIKLRTMINKNFINGVMVSDAERLTPLGHWLRKTSLDEIPELWNVVKGEMSLVGPRPLLLEYLPLYSIEQGRRHEVRPGITGWAQINGRNAISWEDKFLYDVWYVDNQNLWLDIRILWMTIYKVLIRHGISADGEATMTKFKGNKSS